MYFSWQISISAVIARPPATVPLSSPGCILWQGIALLVHLSVCSSVCFFSRSAGQILSHTKLSGNALPRGSQAQNDPIIERVQPGGAAAAAGVAEGSVCLACMNIATEGTVLAACAHSEDKREALGRMQRLV